MLTQTTSSPSFLSKAGKGGEDRAKVDLLVVSQISIPLRHLRPKVHDVASEKEVVPRCDGESVAHEDAAVEGEGGGHFAGDAVVEEGLVSFSFSFLGYQDEVG